MTWSRPSADLIFWTDIVCSVARTSRLMEKAIQQNQQIDEMTRDQSRRQSHNAVFHVAHTRHSSFG